MRGIFRVVLSLLLAGLLCGISAQTTNARLTGTISDPNGAVLSGATVTATSTATGLVKSVTTNDSGVYIIESLPPGPYRLEFQASGFRSLVQNVTLQTQQVATLDAQLPLGTTSENVTVTSDLPLVEAASSNISDVVVGRQIVDLPLNGRNFTQLATLVPGVTRGTPDSQASGSGNQSETFRYASSGGASLAVNGLRPQNNNFLLDGVDNNESLVNTIVFFPPAEAIQEFRVDTSVAPAEFGRAGGGVVNTAIRSGTNSWHGSAFFFTRNDDLDATPYFNQKKPEFRRHQFGGSLGGALIKNKLFIFGDYQGLRQFQPQSQDRATVPTDLMRNGDFSQLLNLPTPILIKNPTTGTPFVGNIIDPSLILAPGQAYLKAYPEPNVTGSNALCGQVSLTGVCIKQNYVTTRNTIQHFNDYDIRADFNMTSRDMLFGRFSNGKETEVTSSRLPALPAGFGSGTQLAKPRSIVLGETHTFSGTIVNEFRFGWVKTQIGYTPPFQDVPLSANLGIPNANTGGALGGGALIGGYNDQLEYTGDYGPYVVPEQTFQASDSVSFVKGHHAIKVGTTLLDRHVNYFRPLSGKGYFFLAGNGGAPSPTGYEVSDVLAGFVARYDVGPALGFSHTQNWETGYYAQDDWKISRRLTLNLGLRYDLYTWPSERNNLQANFDLATGQLVLPGQGVGGAALIPTDTNNFAPRVGFAYDLTGSGKTVLRGGFGIFYFLDRGGIDNQLGQNPPFSGTSSFNYNDGFRINLAGRAPNGTSDPTAATAAAMPGKGPIQIDLTNPKNVAVVAYPTSNQNSYAQEWNLQLQRELGPNTAVSLGYVGTHGVHLMTNINYNRQTYDAAPGVRMYPNINNVSVNDTNGNSIYHAMQAEFRRRLVNGIQFQASYTWSHAIDNYSGLLDTGASDRVDAFNFHNERGNSALDMRHRLVVSSLLELPFGRGKRYGSDMPGVVNTILGGWQLSPILQLQSGQPFDLISSSQQGTRTRPDLVGDPTTLGDINRWFNTAAFADPAKTAAGVFIAPGTAPRNLLYGPSHKRMDFSVFKNFKMGERFTTQFRAQFYNLTNTPQFSQPNGDVSSGAQNFGTVRGTLLSSERQIEMALRLSF